MFPQLLFTDFYLQRVISNEMLQQVGGRKESEAGTWITSSLNAGGGGESSCINLHVGAFAWAEKSIYNPSLMTSVGQASPCLPISFYIKPSSLPVCFSLDVLLCRRGYGLKARDAFAPMNTV